MSTDGKHWWEYVDRTVTLQLLDGEGAAPASERHVRETAPDATLCVRRAHPRVSSDPGEDAQQAEEDT